MLSGLIYQADGVVENINLVGRPGSRRTNPYPRVRIRVGSGRIRIRLSWNARTITITIIHHTNQPRNNSRRTTFLRRRRTTPLNQQWLRTHHHHHSPFWGNIGKDTRNFGAKDFPFWKTIQDSSSAISHFLLGLNLMSKSSLLLTHFTDPLYFFSPPLFFNSFKSISYAYISL